MLSEDVDLPKRWVQLKNESQREGWRLDRINGSHHIFTKAGHRCIPVAFHGGTVSPRYASLVLQQAGLCKEYNAIELEIAQSEKNIEEQPQSTCRIQNKQNSSKGKVIPQPSRSRAEETESVRRARQMEHASQVFRELKLSKERCDQLEDDERKQLLETIQNLVASQNYKEVLELIPPVEPTNFGSSSELYEFNCSILFYHVITLGEYALSTLAFNSSAQQKMINEALDLAGVAMQVSPEQRSCIRELTSNLQQRVAARYLDELQNLHRIYRNRNMGFDDDADDFKFMELTRTMKPGDVKTAATKDELYDPMNKIVSGFSFAVSILDERRIPFSKAMEKSELGESQGTLPQNRLRSNKKIRKRTLTRKASDRSFKSAQFVSLLDCCVRKMLISFDSGNYDEVLRLSQSIGLFVQKNAKMLEIVVMAIAPIYPKRAWATPMMMDGITRFVRDCVPVYRYCNTSLNWKRVAGVLAHDNDISMLKDDCQFDDVVAFLDMVLSIFESSKTYIEHLVISSQTRRFVFDCFLDPIFIASQTLNKVMFGKSNTINRRLRVILTKVGQEGKDMDEVILESQSLFSVFRKRKYNPLRVMVVRLSMSLLRLIQVFDGLMTIDSFAKEEIMESCVHAQARYNILPLILKRCVFLMRVIFNIQEVNIRILQQILVMHMDHDDADKFDLKVEGEDLVRANLSANLTSSAMVRASGIWSFSLVFNLFARRFLFRYVLGDLRRKLLVIDSITSIPILDLSKDAIQIEALALGTILFVTKFGAGFDNSRARSILETVLSNKKNHVWCHSFSNEYLMKQWAKQKVHRFSKLITRLFDVVSNSEVESSITEWDQSVNFLLEKLNMSIIKIRSLPRGTEEVIEKTRNLSKIMKACKSLPQWNHEDLHKIRIHIIQLMEASEKITSLLNRATGGRFPKALSIFNKNWDMGESLLICKGEFHNKETIEIIQDLKYVTAILEEFKRS